MKSTLIFHPSPQLVSSPLSSYVLPSRRTWLSLVLVVLFTAASFSTQIRAISFVAAVWLVVWFLSITFYMIYAVHYVGAVQLTVMGRVFYENLLSCIPAVAIVAAGELWSARMLTGLWGWGGTAVAASCLMGFGMNLLSWSLRRSISALSHTVLGVTNKLLAVVINSVVWDKHGPVLGQVLLALGILSSTLYQQPVKTRAGTNRLTGLRLLLATAAAVGSVVALVWVGISFGAALNAGLGAPASRFGGVRIHLADLQPLIVHQIERGEAAAERLFHRMWDHKHFSDQTKTSSGGRASRGGNPSSSTPAAAAAAANTPDGHATTTAAASAATTTRTDASAAGGSQLDRRSAAVSDDYLKRLRQAASKPFHITYMTTVFWDINPGSIGKCDLDGVPLDCHLHTNGDMKEIADALYYHIPSGVGELRRKYHPNQLRLGMSLESGSYYPDLDDPNLMCMFDAEMSFRTCAQVRLGGR